MLIVQHNYCIQKIIITASETRHNLLISLTVQANLSLRTPLYYGQFVCTRNAKIVHSLPLLYEHLCKADTWFCPFGARIKEVRLYFLLKLHCKLLNSI